MKTMKSVVMFVKDHLSGDADSAHDLANAFGDQVRQLIFGAPHGPDSSMPEGWRAMTTSTADVPVFSVDSYPADGGDPADSEGDAMQVVLDELVSAIQRAHEACGEPLDVHHCDAPYYMQLARHIAEFTPHYGV